MKSQELTVQFQGIDNIPQSIITKFFMAFTKLVEKIFLTSPVQMRSATHG